MKIAIPVNNEGQLHADCGRPQQFLLADVDTRTRSMKSAEMINIPGEDGWDGVRPAFEKHAVSVLICGNMGQGARMNMARIGVTVLAGATVSDSKEILSQFLAGTLELAGTKCNCNGHGHGEGHGDHQCGGHGEGGHGGCGCGGHGH